MKLKMDHKLFDRLRSDEDQRKLVDKLREIGLDQYVELPQIAVMGDTSSGKSSLLSAISGVSFPSADQLTTRCPTQLILTNADTFRGNVRLVRFQVDNESSTGENLFDTGEDKEALTCLGDVPGAITKLTKKLVDEGQYISDDQIVVEMSGPELPNLTLTDLPGLVRTVGDHEDENIIPRVRNMVNRYMSQERTIIIAVVPANVDMHNTEILQAAQEADPNGTRTIAVVTKVDLVDAGAEQAVHDLLLNKKKKMHLGYHAVKCRSQRELTKGTTIEKGISNEIAFFGKHEYWRRLPTELWGVLELSGRLVTILQDNIRRSLPKVISEINARLAVAQKEVSRIGVPLESLGAQRQQLGKWVNQYLRQIEAVMNGQYELFSSLNGCPGPSMSDARFCAVLRQKDHAFRAQIEATKKGDGFGFDESSSSQSSSDQENGSRPQKSVAEGDSVIVLIDHRETMLCKVLKARNTDVKCAEFSEEWLGASRWRFPSEIEATQQDGTVSLKQFIQQNRGDELAIFPSYRVFCSYVQQTVRTWERPALQLLEHYYTQTTLISHRLAAMVLGDTGNTRVEQFINTTADRVLGVLEAAARQELKLLLQYESRPYTQDQRLYEELDKLRQRALRSRLEEAFPPANAHGLVSLTDVARTLGGVSVGQFTLSSVDREALEMEIALQAYLDVASHRFVDVVPMKLNGMILCSFFREMESEFLSITTDKKVGELLQESDGEAARRQHLFDRINTLEKAKCVIESSVPMPAPFY